MGHFGLKQTITPGCELQDYPRKVLQVGKLKCVPVFRHQLCITQGRRHLQIRLLERGAGLKSDGVGRANPTPSHPPPDGFKGEETIRVFYARQQRENSSRPILAFIPENDEIWRMKTP